MCWLVRIVIVSSVSLVIGCSHLFPPQGAERVALVDELVKQQEFGKAQKLLADLDKEDPQFRALANRRRALGPLIERFENTCLNKAGSLQEREQWAEALEVLDEGLDKLPSSKALIEYRQQMVVQRDAYIADLERQMQLLRGKMLPAHTALLEKRAEAQPGNLVYRWELYRELQSSSTLVEDMTRCAAQAQEKGDFDLSGECLMAAESLVKAPEANPLLAQLRQQQDSVEEKAEVEAEAEAEVAAAAVADSRELAAKKAARKARRELKKLKNEYLDLYAAGWWLEARKKLMELQARAPAGDRQVAAWQENLQEIIDARVEEGIKQGQVLYSQGFLLQALNVWRETSNLAPENAELNAHIARVERFLNKLNRLHAFDG